MLTINTHMGLYRYKRLPYGVASAVPLFQLEMEKLLIGIPGVSVYLDDILITAKSEVEHIDRLQMVLSRLKDTGLRLDKDKCSFMLDSVTYLGYVVSKNGLQTNPKRLI